MLDHSLVFNVLPIGSSKHLVPLSGQPFQLVLLFNYISPQLVDFGSEIVIAISNGRVPLK